MAGEGVVHNVLSAGRKAAAREVFLGAAASVRFDERTGSVAARTSAAAVPRRPRCVSAEAVRELRIAGVISHVLDTFHQSSTPFIGVFIGKVPVFRSTGRHPGFSHRNLQLRGKKDEIVGLN